MDNLTTQGFLLSPQQRRLWRLQQAEPSAAYRSECALRIEGELDPAALRQVLDEVVSRHEILRTAFRQVPGVELPLQVILDPVEVPLREVELSGGEERPETVADLLDRAGRRDFDLEQGVVLLASLVKLSPREHVLLLEMPALCADAASCQNLVAEIAAAFSRLREGAAAEDGDQPMQYVDLAEWQNQLLEAEDSAEHLERWRQLWRDRDIETHLAAVLPFEEDSGEPFSPATLTVPLAAGLNAGIAHLLRDWDVAPGLFFLAVWQMLWRRSTGQADVVVGVLHDGRKYEELQSALGLFARFLPVHVRLEETLRPRQVLDLVREAGEEVARRQERFSWQNVQGGAASPTAFFPLCFEEGEAAREHAVDGLRFAVSRRAVVSDRFKLDLAWGERKKGNVLELRYDAARFQHDSVELIAERLVTLLESLVARPEAPLDDQEILGERERRLLAELGSPSRGPRPRKGSLHSLFAAQVARSPERPAVWAGGAQLTYSELNTRANRLAHHLLALGVKTGEPVALCFERSLNAVVAILGVLKAGGAWVPLDPTHPRDRLAFLLADSGGRVLVAAEPLLDSLPLAESPGVRVVCPDRDAAAIAQRPATDPGIEVPEDSLAYTIYTSGSTGRPKGVLVAHRSAVDLLAGLEAAVLSGAGGAPLRASLNAPFAFDASVQQLVLLLAGHTLFLVPEEVRTDGAALLGFLRDQAVDVFDCTPSQLRILLGGGLLDAPVPVPRLVLVAGEAIDEPTWTALAASDRTTFFNIYGPTECTVDATAHRIGDPPAGSIGRPLAGYEVHLLDRGLEPVPLGAPGELAIGGSGLARGYARRPDLTAERFVPHPSGRPGDRLYRTGDLGRLRPSGHLEFLGRVDQQVKIRGYRIELGEIETVLLDHPWVEGAVVVPRQEDDGVQLVAYFTPAAHAPLAFQQSAEGDLHEALRQRLPLYMIPSTFVAVPTFPLTANGKVDRRALSERRLPERRGRRSGAQRIAPRTENEQLLATIWQEVLRAEEVSVDDNFFQLGGDSILSIQVISRARQRGLHLTARQMFEHQTIAELARVASSRDTAAVEAEIVTGAVPLTPIQKAYFEQGLVHPEHYNQTLLLEVAPEEGRLALGALRRALTLLLEHHDALRMRYVAPDAESPSWRQVNEPPAGEPPLGAVDLSTLPEDRRRGALETAADALQRSLELNRGHLLRAVAFHLGPETPDRFLMVVHHLVVDGVSWRILLEDLENLYRAISAGEEPALPPKTTAFRRWAERLVEHAGSAAVARQVAYWLERLDRPADRLPVDSATGENTVTSVRSIAVSLDEDETRDLLQQVPRAYRTQINDVLLTALAEAVGTWTGHPRLWLELEGHGREEIFPDLDVSRTVGWFTTTFPVLLDLEGAHGPGDRLKTVKEQLRALPERGFAWGLARYLGPLELRERMHTLPQPEVVFNYLGQFDQSVAEGRLFRPARESSGAGRHPAHRRTSLLEINGSVSSGRLRMSFAFSEEIHRRENVEAVAQGFLAALRDLIAHCLSPEAGGVTPSDFPLAAVDQVTLDQIAAAVSGGMEDVYPPTPMQQGLVFHSLLAPRSGAHIGQLSLVFRGRLDPAAFAAAWRQVLDRHTILRTGFHGVESDRPMQVVHRQVPLPLDVLDWRDLSAEEQRERLASRLEEGLRRGFDLAAPPLMRLALIRIEEEAYRFVWQHHHAILDGWSLPILLRELLAFYEAGLRGTVVSLDRPAAFRDYIAWLVQQDLGAAEEFWRRELVGVREPSALGGERPAVVSPQEDPIFQSVRGSLTGADTDALRALARAQQLTFNTLVQGAWALLLRAHGGADDVVFGVVSSGRAAPVQGIETLVGILVNTLPARISVRPGTELVEWLQGIQSRQFEARQFEHSPLVQVQAWSEIPRGLPLFESLLAFENFPVDDTVRERAGRTMGIGDTEVFEQSNYPLALAAVPGPGLDLKITYDPRRFAEDDIGRRMGHLRNLLAGMIAAPGRPVAELPLLSELERQQVLVGWSGLGAENEPGARTLPERLADMARQRPDATAAVLGGERLSYGELVRQARALSRRLAREGVRPGSRVGLAVERSFEMLVGVLGIWQAGAAYVPLDPGYPAERLAFLSADAGLSLVLTQADVAERLPLAGVPRLLLEVSAASAQDLQGDEPKGPLPELPAYVIYTSGSTGRPKGVVVPHAGVPNLAAEQSRLFGVGPESRVLQFASPSFDAAVSELAMTFWVGATLVLAPRESLVPGEDLLALLRDQKVTTVTLPPSALAALPEAELPSLETLVVAGEACPVDLARRWAAGRRLINAYGPTETTVCATAGLWDGGERLLLGDALPGLQVYLLDGWGDLVPVGAIGELYVGGRGLAQGYLGLPERTAERFVPHPFATAPGERLYRTGDLARRRADGGLEFLGRADHQVKVRGHRVELGEVEAVLQSHSAVQEAAVVVRHDLPGGTAMVGAVVLRQPVGVTALRDFLRERLPELMVPGHWRFLSELPLTPNGKVDRAALARLDGVTDPAGQEAPRTAVEELVAGIFATVLRRETVRASDDFFELGGHSLLATQVTSRLRSTFGVELPLRTLFEEPTARGLGSLVERLLQSAGGREAPPLVPMPRERELPLSFAQERLWFLDQLAPGTATYNMPVALGLRGALSWPALAASLSAIAARHEALRTTFAAVEGRPVQVTHPASPVAPPVFDLRALPAERRSMEALRLAAEEASRPFDLAQGPLLRCVLVRQEEELHLAVLNLHHIISDGWSMGVLVRELGELYAGFVAAEPPLLPPLPVQYADFAIWQRSWLAGEELARQLAYWHERLAGAPALLDLPLDRPRPALQTFRGDSLSVRFPRELSRQLSALGRSHGATLFMVALAGFTTLLARVSGQDDVVVGTPVANRNRAETEGVIGFFVNTLALRGRVAAGLSFSDWLGISRETALGAYAHQDLPFEKLVDELKPERSLSHSPIFQVLLVMQNTPAGALHLPGLTFEPTGAAAPAAAKFDLTLILTDSEAGITGSWELNPDLFDRVTVSRLASSFERLLAAVADRPSERLIDLPLLSREELHQIVVAWNDTGGGPARPLALHERVEAWAERTPSAPAVLFGGEALSYADLDRRADRLARELRRRGIGREDRVGLFVERSFEMVAGIVGVLKAGASFVPLDPSYPRERLDDLVTDAGLAALLAQEGLAGSLPATGAEVLFLDSAAPGEPEPPGRTPWRGATLPEDPAYVIYTSGSTGRPKGVIVPHRGWSNLAEAQLRLFGLSAADRVLQFASPSFDASVWELALAFGSGGTLVLASRDELLPGPDLLRVLRDCTMATLPPTALAVLPFEELPALHTLVVAGEACPPELARRWAAGRRFFNAYGPTESSVCASAKLYTGGALLTLGEPVANATLHVLDRWGSPLPIGVPGELCIGGAGLARGYHQQPDRTAERFLPNPFSTQPGERLYRTGDLARYRADGDLEFLGRIDHQVKIRGFRIELGEIEAVLGEHPGVAEIAAIVREDAPGDRRLTVYVVMRGEETGMAELRAWLQERLPAHAIPSAFVPLAALPLTPNGKVDRKALPAPERVLPEGELAAPRTVTEELLVRLWSEVLRLPQVGVHDNFFALGGDSILSIQVVARAAREGCRITPRQIFEYQTIAALAAVAGTEAAAVASQETVTGPVPLTPIQSWFFADDPVDPHHFNQSVLLAVRGPVSPEIAARALAALTTHHDALRLRFAAEEGGWRQWNATPAEAPVSWLRVDLSGLPHPLLRAALLAAAEPAQASLDLTAGPLVRGVWVDLPEGNARLLLVVHHLVVDGVSWRVLLEDLESACRQLLAGGSVALPAKTTSFQSWSRQLSEHARTMPLEPEMTWWRAEVAPGDVRLPADLPGGEGREASTQNVSIGLDSDETRALLQEAPLAFRTQINDLLLTALALALAGPGRALLVDLEGHGREEILPGVDLSRTMGWFTTLFPVRLAIPAGAGPAEALLGIKEHLRSIPGRGIGWGLLRWLRGGEVSRELAALPSPEISFNYLGQFDQVLESDSLFAAAGEPSGPPRSLRARRSHRLDVVGAVGGGRLRIDLGYSSEVFERATIEALAGRFLERLRELLALCRSAVERRAALYSASDFPLAGLATADLARLLGDVWGVEDVYPLSPLQEGILFHSLYAPSSGAYVEQLVARFAGAVDAAALAEACRRVVAHHPILRTSFHWRDLEKPLQVVHAGVEIALEHLDWRGVDAADRQERLAALLRADRQKGFDLSVAPVMRWTLVSTAEDEHWLLWSHHHLLLDGWSFSAVAGEFLASYAASQRGEVPALPRHRPFRDYIAWLQQQDSGAAEAYWRRALAGWDEPTPLPVARTSEATAGSQTTWRLLGTEPTAALREQARSHQLTINALVQEAWALLLGRHAGVEDVVFGVTVSGRPAELAGIESMVGLFINTLPLRVDVTGSHSLLAGLREVQNRQAELSQHEHTPLVQVQGWSGVHRGRSLFDSILVFENYPREQAMSQGSERGGGLAVAEVRAIEQTNYPLTLVAVPGDDLLLRLDHDLSHYDGETAGRLLGHLATLLTGMAEGLANGGAAPLATLPMLSPQEIRQTLAGEPGMQAASGMEPVHAGFARQAAFASERVALTGDGESLTYGALDERANRIARRLRRLGVGPDRLVGLCMERSPDMVVAILGILKAGGGYLPLDPAYPHERLAFMLADAGAVALVTHEGLLPSLPETGLPVLCLDRDQADIDRESGADPAVQVTPENLAYVIYTSGSTGQPKGTMVTHANVARLFAVTRDRFTFGDGDVWTLFHSFAFDFSVWEIWGALLHGGRLVVVPWEVSRTPAAFAELLRREGVTVLNQTPSAFRQLLPDLSDGDDRLRLVIFGGEALEPATLGTWLDRGGKPPLAVNMYGITETTVHVTWRDLGGADLERRSEGSPIGRPLDDLWIALLDRDGNPVPAGAPGEIYVGGAGLMRGYLGRPGLTAERLVPSPFGEEPGARLYRSGDLARFAAGGDLEYLGRIDQQVKIRGFRIELGEIEAALVRHPEVRTSALAVREPAPGDLRLVAYLVPTEPGTAQRERLIAEVRELVRQRLPEHMIPSSWVVLDELPLTTNGKLDRAALPDPGDFQRPGAEIAPLHTPAEEILAGLFTEVLGVGPLGAEDDFFASGGHSLLATRLISRVRSAFGVELPLQDVFEYPTIAGLAARIEGLLRGGGDMAPPLVASSREGEIPLSFAQERLWFLDQLTPGLATYNLPFALGFQGPLSVPALAAALAGVVARHEVLRTTFALSGGAAVQIIHPDLPVTPAVIDLSGLPEERRRGVAREIALVEASRPFDLGTGPLLRVALLRLAEESHSFLLTLHHIVADGWSLDILMRELGALYAAAAEGREPVLPPLPVQYADFAIWQRSWLSGEELERQTAYWRGHLQGAPPLLDLPLDRPRPALQSFRGASTPVHLPAEPPRTFQELARAQGATLFMLVLASFQALLSRLARQEDLVVGTPVANRGRRETEDLIGFFVNTLALRGRPDGSLPFSAWLRQVRETALAAYAHQDLPFEKLVETLQPQRSLSHAPIFQTMLVLQNAPASARPVGGLATEPAALPPQAAAKFDLVLSLEERGSGLSGSVDYSVDLFDAATIARFLGQLRNLLTAAVERPDLPLADLPLLSPAEEGQLLAWNEMARVERPPVCLHDLIAAQARLTPDAVAVESADWSLTYRELDAAAERLARSLRGLGVGPEVPVGLSLGRSPWLPVGILGILKAGGGYVPLDTAYPAERLAMMMADALGDLPAPLVLTEREHADLFTDALLPRLRTLFVDEEREESGEAEGTPAAPEVLPDHLAYIIFTSGSTGRPKGVALSHRGLVDLVASQARLFEVGPGSRCLQFAALGFDASVAEIAVTLGAGGTLCFAERSEMLPGINLMELLSRREISVVTLPPSGLAVMPFTELPSLRTLVVAGEPCPVDLARLWSHGRRFVNAYGPTETTVCASAEVFNETEDRLPIGWPIDNAELHVLDPALRQVPVGVTGELYLAGPGLARGYLRRADLTAGSFIPHPWSAAPGGRLYRTGDLARRLPDGRVEVSGRRDHQVKLRGFRIELGEIEEALRQHPGVLDAVVVRREEAGESSLAAWIVPLADEVPPSDLRVFLAATLPSFMIPAHLSSLAALPLMPSGKPDRRSLATRPLEESAPAGVAPRNRIEEKVAALFAQILRRESVGVTDDFFALGGHSLLAVGLMARLEEAFGQRLSLAMLFEGPTVEQIAAHLASERPAEARRSLIAIRREGTRPPFFCVHPIGGGVTDYYRHLVTHLSPDQPVYGLQALDLERRDGALDARIEAIAGRYLDEVRAFQPAGPYLLGGASYGGLIAFEMAQQLRRAGAPVALVALIDTVVPGVGEMPDDPGERPEADSVAESHGMARALARMYGKELELSLDDLRGLGLEEALGVILEHARALGLAAQEIDVPWLLRYRESFNARIEGAARYRAQPYDGRIAFFRSSEGATGADSLRPDLDKYYAWEQVAPDVEARAVPGDHETMLLEPHVRALAESLDDCLVRAVREAAADPEAAADHRVQEALLEDL